MWIQSRGIDRGMGIAEIGSEAGGEDYFVEAQEKPGSTVLHDSCPETGSRLKEHEREVQKERIGDEETGSCHTNSPELSKVMFCTSRQGRVSQRYYQ